MLVAMVMVGMTRMVPMAMIIMHHSPGPIWAKVTTSRHPQLEMVGAGGIRVRGRISGILWLNTMICSKNCQKGSDLPF